MAKTKAKAKKEKEYVTVYTPVGMISYPFLLKPDTGRTESSLKFSIEIFVPKAKFKSEAQEMVDAVLKVAREFHGNPKLKLSDIQNPFKDMDTVKDAKPHEKGTYRIRAKAGKKDMTKEEWSKYRPVVIGARKDETGKFPKFTDEQIAKIKGGDFGRLICSVYGYDQQGGGVALGLNFLQFAHEGAALGQGKMKALEELQELEVEVDDPDDLEDTEDAAAEEVEAEDTEEESDSEMDFG